MKLLSESIYERNLAIGSTNNRTGAIHFQFRGEFFNLQRHMALDRGRPNRRVMTFSIPELKFGFVAHVDEVRHAAALEATL